MEVARDWGAIAKAFPFLELKCQLFDREGCEDGGKPLVEFVVNGGTVTIGEPSVTMEPHKHSFLPTALLTRSERGCTEPFLREAVEGFLERNQ
jgi:hypothetical protein